VPQDGAAFFAAAKAAKTIGRFAGLHWVEPRDVTQAAQALGATDRSTRREPGARPTSSRTVRPPSRPWSGTTRMRGRRPLAYT
jgi:hypothetical protein